MRFHFLCDLSKHEIIELKHCKSRDQIVDILTKTPKLVGVWEHSVFTATIHSIPIALYRGF